MTVHSERPCHAPDSIPYQTSVLGHVLLNGVHRVFSHRRLFAIFIQRQSSVFLESALTTMCDLIQTLRPLCQDQKSGLLYYEYSGILTTTNVLS